MTLDYRRNVVDEVEVNRELRCNVRHVEMRSSLSWLNVDSVISRPCGECHQSSTTDAQGHGEVTSDGDQLDINTNVNNNYRPYRAADVGEYDWQV